MPDWKYPPESSEQPGRTYGKAVPLKFRSQVFDNNRTGCDLRPRRLQARPARPPR